MQKHLTILLVEDNPNDVVLVKLALKRNEMDNPVQVVTDGVEAIDYLSRNGRYRNDSIYPVPGIIFMDLKMPRLGGFGVLEWIRKHPNYTVIPTIILTSSKEDGDVSRAYTLGANSFFVKPMTFEELREIIALVCTYWDRCETPKICSA